jgi:hypothetical protein
MIPKLVPLRHGFFESTGFQQVSGVPVEKLHPYPHSALPLNAAVHEALVSAAVRMGDAGGVEVPGSPLGHAQPSTPENTPRLDIDKVLTPMKAPRSRVTVELHATLEKKTPSALARLVDLATCINRSFAERRIGEILTRQELLAAVRRISCENWDEEEFEQALERLRGWRKESPVRRLKAKTSAMPSEVAQVFVCNDLVFSLN